MPFIPPDFLETLRQQVDLAAIIGQRLPLKARGQHFLGLCPFHQEKTASFYVYPQANPPHYHCFGCGEHGDAIGFIMRYEHCHFQEAVERLANMAGLTLPLAEEATAAQRENQRLLGLLDAAQAFFASQRPKVAAYLKARQIRNETAERFALGFCSGQEPWTTILGASHAELESIGLFSQGERGFYSRFQKRLIFPIRQRQGNTVGFGGRALAPGQQPKYLNSPESRFFRKQSLFYGFWEAKVRKQPRYILVEGYLDVLQLAQQGFPEAIASMGTSIQAEGLRQLLSSSSSVYFCLDGDSAGQKATLTALHKLLPSLHDTDRLYFIELPPGLDPDDFLKNHGAEAFDKALAKAPLFPEYFFYFLRQNFDLKSISGRVAALSYAKPLLESMKAPILRQEMQYQLQQEVRQTKTTSKAHPPPNTTLTAARLALGLLLRYPQLLAEGRLNQDLKAYFTEGAALFFALQTWLESQYPDLQAIDQKAFRGFWRELPEAIHLEKLPKLLENRLEYQDVHLAKACWKECLQRLESDSVKEALHHLRSQHLALDDPRLQQLLTLLQQRQTVL